MIAKNIAAIRENMTKAALACGRDPSEILLCAATKMNGAEAVQEAIRGGVDLCGENKVQELTGKLAQHAYDGKPVHFIGHLQTNKVKQVVGKVDLIQSVDRLPLLACIEKEAAKQGIVQDILLEVNIGNEESKSGFTAQEVRHVAQSMADFPHCRLRGLMAIPPVCSEAHGNSKYFAEMYHIFVDIRAKKYDNVDMVCLSMGMSDDYADAIAHGSTMVRVGTAIFGARHYGQ